MNNRSCLIQTAAAQKSGMHPIAGLIVVTLRQMV